MIFWPGGRRYFTCSCFIYLFYLGPLVDATARAVKSAQLARSVVGYRGFSGGNGGPLGSLLLRAVL